MNEKNIVWQPSLAKEQDRSRLLGQTGCVVWFTGLSGSGKSTLAYACEKKLIENQHPAFVLDGDNLRHGLNADLSFSPEDRSENIRRVTHVSSLLADAGLITLTAFISPYRRDREKARSVIGPERFIEVFLEVPLEVCESRDPKELYQRARAGEIENFTGISAPYEPPDDPELKLNTAETDREKCVKKVLSTILPRTATE